MVLEKLTFSPLSRRQIEAGSSGANTRIVFRGDSGFYRPRLLSWCDRNKEVDVPSMLVRRAYNKLGEKVSATYRFQYQART